MKQRTENREQRTIKMFSVPISITSKDQALAIVTNWLRRWRTPKVIVTPNPEIIVSAQKDPEFLKALQSADLAIPDGIGIVWALRILRRKVPKVSLSRLSGLDFMESLITLAARRGWRVMLVGGKPGVAQKATELLNSNLFRASSFGFRIFGISGPQDIFHCSPEEMNKLIIGINQFKPDLLFVAFGHGKQEPWMKENRSRLQVGVMMGVGGALDQIVDPSLRPPSYINSIGLGWLYRLARQPWRWRRQLNLFRFIKMVIKQRVTE